MEALYHAWQEAMSSKAADSSGSGSDASQIARVFLETLKDHQPDLLDRAMADVTGKKAAEVGDLISLWLTTGVLPQGDEGNGVSAMESLFSQWDQGGSSDLEPGSTCGNFRIIEKIGEGGTGCVYLAERADDLQQKVAVKTVHIVDPRWIQTFKNESQILSKLRHPNIAHLIDVGILPDQRPWLAMEYVEGTTLDCYLKIHQPNLEKRLQLFLKVCEAVTYAHHQMVIHKDLKPSNIMIQPSGEPKLLDFGIAASLNPGTEAQITVTSIFERIMTPEYASPEQLSGERLTSGSDVYSLGLILYKLLTGNHPYDFKERNIDQILKVIQGEPVKAPSVLVQEQYGSRNVLAQKLKGDLNTIVLKALEHSPDRRYQSVDVFAADIRCHLDNLPIQAQPATRWYRLHKFLKRHPWQSTLGCFLVLTFIAFSTLSHFQARRLSTEHARVLQEKRRAEKYAALLVEIFEQADPRLSQTGEVSAFEVMERGMRHVDKSLKEEPIIHAQILTTAGRIYRSLGHYERSYSVLKQASEKSGRKVPEAYLTDLELIHTLQVMGSFEDAKEHLNHLMKRYGEAGDSLFKARCNIAAARLWFACGNYKRSESFLSEAFQNRHVLSDRELSQLIRHRAELNYAQGFIQESIKDWEHLLHQSRESGVTLDERAYYQAQLGSMLINKGDFETGNDLLTESESLFRSIYGDLHPVIMECLHRRVNLYCSQGQFQEAKKSLQEAHQQILQILPDRHPLMADNLTLRGEIQVHLGEYGLAEASFREALTITKANYEEHHILVIGLINNLGLALALQGDYASAESLYRKAIETTTSFFGPEHPSIANFASNLASTQQAQGDYHAAEAYVRRSMEINQTVYGEDHPEIAKNYEHFGILMRQMGRWAEHEEALQRALDIRFKHFGENSFPVANTRNSIAVGAAFRGEFQSAKNELEVVSQIFETHLGFSHPRTSLIRNNLGAIYRLIGDYPASEQVYQKSLFHLREASNSDQPGLVRCLIGLGDLKSIQGLVVEAEAFYSEANELFEQNMTGDKWIPIEILTNRASNLINLDQMEKATQCLNQAMALAADLDRDRILVKIKILKAKLALAAGEYENALNYLKDAESVRQEIASASNFLKARIVLEEAKVRLLSGDLELGMTALDEADVLFKTILPRHHETLHEIKVLRGGLLVRQGQESEGLILIEEGLYDLKERMGINHFAVHQLKRVLKEADIPSQF